MDLLTLLIVGLIAGLLASLVVGGVGYGILGDIVIGICGAFLGAWLFRTLEIRVPFGGLGGTIFIAFVGATVLLVILRVIGRGRRA
jgi:uncharacterized membrane protein YeaQ/YmgE (transglycosylase-associated protein family)